MPATPKSPNTGKSESTFRLLKKLGQFWKRPESVVASVREYDPIEDWITSDDFKAFVRYQMDQEVEFEPSEKLTRLDERIASHRPMDGLRVIGYRGYVVDDTRYW